MTRLFTPRAAIAPGLSLLLLTLSCPTYAASIEIDFTSSSYFDASFPATVANPAWWDSVNGRIWTPTYTAQGGVEFGNGSDGAFDGVTPISGITISGANITISTGTLGSPRIYQFTSFHLPAGKTLTPVGQNALVIRVRGSTTIEGEIAAHGENGGNFNPDLSLTLPATAGAAGAGGGAGGRGGYYSGLGNIAAQTGESPVAGVDGGDAGLNNVGVAGMDEGGGGGFTGTHASHNASSGYIGAGGVRPNPGNAGSCSAGATLAQQFESTFVGGGGGGGGGAFYDGGDSENAGAGGGGGGAVRISSQGPITLLPGGLINVRGGNGGENATGAATPAVDSWDCGGGGGGGAGGSVWLQSAASVTGASNTINIQGGTGGGLGNCTTNGPYAGGDGSRGILRIDLPGFAPAPTSLDTLPITPAASSVGIRSPMQSFVYYSKPLSMSSGYYALSTPTETLACGSQGSLVVTYEGSRDGTSFEHPVEGNRISELNDYAYIRFKVTITMPDGWNASAVYNTPCLIGLSIPYEPMDLNRIELSGGLACAGLKRDSRTPPSAGASALLRDLALLAVAYLFVRRPGRRRSLASQPV